MAFALQPPWTEWYRHGSQDDDEIYASALEKCKQVNSELNSEPWWDGRRGSVASMVVESSPIRIVGPRLYDASWMQNLIARERNRIEQKQAAEPVWLQKLSGLADGVIKVATEIKPIIDIFIPRSPEYSVPYACLWIVFKGVAGRIEKKDSVLGLITSLSDDIPVLEAYRDMFPTDEMKLTLAQYYVHTVDLLWRLAKYYSHNFCKQLTDAILPRAKYNFNVYLRTIQATAAKLKSLCDIGHVAEQKDMKHRIDILSSELQQLGKNLQATHSAQAQHYALELIDIWNDDVGDVENEISRWQAFRFSTDMRDHWSQNGILPCIAEWRKECDTSCNSILWVSSQCNGRQFWLTEFSVDLIKVCQSQGQLIMFAMCDRPRRIKWTPKQLFKQLIAQLLSKNPDLPITRPAIFNSRAFRRATTFNAIFQLLHSILGSLGSVVIVIDRLDLCTIDENEKHVGVADALSMLIRAHPKSVRVIVTTGQVMYPPTLSNLPISFATVNTRRRPRRRSPPHFFTVNRAESESDSETSSMHVRVTKQSHPQGISVRRRRTSPMRYRRPRDFGAV